MITSHHANLKASQCLTLHMSTHPFSADTAGLVGLRIRNAGYNLSVVDEIRVLDDSGMLKTDKLYQKRTTGQVNFRRNIVAEEEAQLSNPITGEHGSSSMIMACLGLKQA